MAFVRSLLCDLNVCGAPPLHQDGDSAVGAGRGRGAQGMGSSAHREDSDTKACAVRGASSPFRAQPQSLLLCKASPDSPLGHIPPLCLLRALHLPQVVTSQPHMVPRVPFPLACGLLKAGLNSGLSSPVPSALPRAWHLVVNGC